MSDTNGVVSLFAGRASANRNALLRGTIRERLGLMWSRFREWLAFDSSVFRGLAVSLGLAAGVGLWNIGARRRAASILGRLHRAHYSQRASDFIQRALQRRLTSPKTTERETALRHLLRTHISDLQITAGTSKFFHNPEKLLGSAVMILKEAGGAEKGVIALQYTYVFPLFARLFDIEAICKRYHLVLEPSWCGYCDPDILSFATLRYPVFVEASEPRDAQLIRALGSNLKVVPIAANWWTDHRVFRPLPIKKDVDIFMNAAWATYKRHAAFFRAVARMRERGRSARIVLVGFPIDLSQSDIRRLAELYDVADQIELFENLSPEEVNAQINRAKVSILWSRREGFNRSVIENMFAGVPCILHESYNYGYRHPYINPMTGEFASDADLPQTLERMLDRHEDYRPRDWTMEHMSCHRATSILYDCLARESAASGETFSSDLAIKVAGVSGMRYWDSDRARTRFEGDYEFLRTQIRAR